MLETCGDFGPVTSTEMAIWEDLGRDPSISATLALGGRLFNVLGDFLLPQSSGMQSIESTYAMDRQFVFSQIFYDLKTLNKLRSKC